MRGGRCEWLEGEDCFSRCMLVQFPSYAAAREWYQPVDHTRLEGLREGSVDVDSLPVAGCQPDFVVVEVDSARRYVRG